MDLNVGKLADALAKNEPIATLRTYAGAVVRDYLATRDLYYPSEELLALVDAQEPCGGEVTAEIAADLLVAAHALVKQVGAYPVHRAIKERAKKRGLV